MCLMTSKKSRNHSCESFCYVKDNFDKMHLQPARLYFLFEFCARHYSWWSLRQKNTKNNYFIQVKPPFSVVEFSNTVTFWRNARFDVILTSVTIIKQGFLRNYFVMSAWLHVQSERLYFLFAFCARHYPWWSLWQKNTKNNYFIQVNPLFRLLKSVTLLLFEEMLVLTSY